MVHDDFSACVSCENKINKNAQGSLSIPQISVCVCVCIVTQKTPAMSSKQATITNLFQMALDNGAHVSAAFEGAKVEAQPPPQTRRCTTNEGKSKQCKNRVPFDAKWKQCEHCREIKKKSQQKRRAAFRADSVAQAAVAAQVVVPPGHVRCSNNANSPSWCKRTFSSKSKFKHCAECRGIVKKSDKKRRAAFRADSAAQAAAAAQVVIAPGHVRCSARANTPNWCKHTFSAKSKFKQCAECRASVNKSDKKRRADPEIRAQMAEYCRAYNQTPAGKASAKRSSKKQNKKPVTKLRACLRNTLKHAGVESRTLKELGTFYSNEDVKKHFETTFADWMNWDNHGALRHTDGHKCVWHIGHRIPCAVYNLNDLSDAHKCFDRRNLFAQDAKENLELSDKLALTDEELDYLKPVWPSEAVLKGLDWFKKQFAKANETSRAILDAKLKAERARAETLGESADTADEDDEDDDEDDEDEDVPDDEDELFDDEKDEDEEEESEEESEESE